jgi:hypothetical protein
LIRINADAVFKQFWFERQDHNEFLKTHARPSDDWTDLPRRDSGRVLLEVCGKAGCPRMAWRIISLRTRFPMTQKRSGWLDDSCAILAIS